MQQKKNKTYIIKKKVEKLSVRKKTLTRLLSSSAFCGTTYILYNVEFHLKSNGTICHRVTVSNIDKHFREKTIGLYCDAEPVG